MPIGSWPRTSPRSMNGPRVSYRCRSDPQMLVLVILTMASVGCSIRGSGTSSTETFRLPCQVTARTHCSLCRCRGLTAPSHRPMSGTTAGCPFLGADLLGHAVRTAELAVGELVEEVHHLVVRTVVLRLGDEVVLGRGVVDALERLLQVDRVDLGHAVLPPGYTGAVPRRTTAQSGARRRGQEQLVP